MELLKEAAKDIVNKNLSRNHNTKLEKQNPHGCMFEGITSLKQETDQEDEYLIYNINEDCNNHPSYMS